MDDILSSILGLGGPVADNPLGYYGSDGSTTLTNDAGSNPLGAASTSPVISSENGTSWITGLLNFATKALPVASSVNSLVSGNQGTKAANNTSSANSSLASVASNPIVWIIAGAIGLVLVLILVLKE